MELMKLIIPHYSIPKMVNPVAAILLLAGKFKVNVFFYRKVVVLFPNLVIKPHLFL